MLGGCRGARRVYSSNPQSDDPMKIHRLCEPTEVTFLFAVYFYSDLLVC